MHQAIIILCQIINIVPFRSIKRLLIFGARGKRESEANKSVRFMFQIFLSTPNADVDDCLEHETHIKIVAMIYNFTIKTYKYIFDHIGTAGLAQPHVMAC